MADALAAHMTIEEELFYPAVKAERTEDILLESLEEHLSLRRVLADLLAIAPEDAKFEPKLHVLVEQAEHHHEEEEEHLFPKVKKLLGAERLDKLGTEMHARMERLREQAVRTRVPQQTADSTDLA
jgi:hemerythrin superfamily protein